MKNLFIIGGFIVMTNVVHAFDFIEGGLAYNIMSDNPEAVTVARGGEGEHVIIPSQVTHEGKTYKVVEISDLAFLKFEEMKSLKIEEGVETIGENAFMYCTSLTFRHIFPKKS